MQTILHLLKWQIRQQRVLLFVNSILLTSLLVLPMVSEREALGLIVLILKVGFLVGSASLVTSMIHSQPYTGSESFWMTRPLSRRALLASQLLLLSLFIFLPALLGMLAMTYHMDGEVTHYIGALLTWGIYIGAFLFFFALISTTSTVFGAIALLVTIFLVSGILGNTATSNMPSASRPNPDAMVIIMPALGLLSLALITVFIRQISKTRIAIILLGLCIIPLLSVIQSFRLGSTPEERVASAPRIEMLSSLPADLDPRKSSYFYPVLFSSENLHKVSVPDRLSLETDSGTFIHKYFRTNNTLLTPLFTDKMIARFPEAEEIVSTTNIAPFLNVAGNEFLDMQGKSVDSFTLESKRAVSLCLTDYSIQSISALPFVAGASQSEAGLRFTIRSVGSYKNETQVQYSLQNSITKDIYDKRRWRSVYLALYDTRTKRLMLQLNVIGRFVPMEKSSLTTSINEGSFYISTDLITETTELHVVVIKKGESYCVSSDALPGTYHSR